MAQSIEKQNMAVAPIEPECHFVEVGREMLGADPMPRANDPALKKRECGFDRVGGDHEAILVADVFFRLVVDALALGSLRNWQSLIVENGFIGHDHVYVFANMLFQYIADCLGVGVSYVDKLQLPIALNDSDDGFFVIAIIPTANAFLLSADVGLINLNGAIKHLLNFGHREADSVAQVPRGFVRTLVLSPDRPLDLKSAHSLFRFAEQECCKEPFLQGEMRIVEYGAGRDGKLIIAALAVEQLFFRGEFHCGHLAARAFDTVGPAEPHKQFAALFVGVEMLNQVN